ncbi:hypothetical protein D3C71_2022630 [compost metagenome]
MAGHGLAPGQPRLGGPGRCKRLLCQGQTRVAQHHRATQAHHFGLQRLNVCGLRGQCGAAPLLGLAQLSAHQHKLLRI